MLTRAPCLRLSPFVKQLWASSPPTAPAGPAAALVAPNERERVLPTGAAHLVFRLDDAPLRLFRDAEAATADSIGHHILGGPRERFYVRDVSQPASSVGAQLLPGALPWLTGIPAHVVHDRHVSLDDVWGRRVADDLRSALLASPTPAARLDLFERFLRARLPDLAVVHPVVRHALARIEGAVDIDVKRIVDETGFSHRHFLDLFTHAVGLTPKRYARVVRFQRARELLATPSSLAAITYEAGFGDQPHFAREFRAITGLTPTAYRREKLRQGNHVPIGAR